MSDKMREEFEEAYADYCAEHGWKTYTAFHMLSEVYVKASTELAWNMWKASRASLVIELPKIRRIVMGRRENECDSGFNDAVDLCTDAIVSAGLKVKP